MIRNVVIHISNEQPLLADLYDLPTSSDVSLVCTNIRMLDGKKPVFIDRVDSVFVFPYATIRFLEIMAAAVPNTGGAGAEPGTAVVVGAADATSPNGADDEEFEPDAELDEDFLRRIRDI